MSSSKTIKIFKRFGLKFALVYNIKKKLRKLQKALYKYFAKPYSYFVMFFYCTFALKNPHKAYKICKRFHYELSHTQSLAFITKHYDEIISWTQSQEFKEKYLNINHPYPPLLNPERLNAALENKESQKDKQLQSMQSPQLYANLSYESISAEIAWDLNLPLPREYKSIWLYNSCSGGEAIQTFFEMCNVELCTICWRFKDYKSAYLYLYKSYLQGKYIIFSFNNWQDNAQRFAALLDKKVPIFCIARDPISRLKTIINHLDNPSWDIDSSFKNFTLKSEIYFPTMYYRGAFKLKPDISIIGKDMNFSFPPNELGSITTRLNWLKNATSEVIFLSIDEISGKMAFDTFINLSQKLQFDMPLKMKVFEGKVNRYEGLLMLPCILNANTKDIDKNTQEVEIKIIISTHQLTPNTNKNLCNIAPLIDIKMPQDNMICYTNARDYKTLSENELLLANIKIYLQKYMKALEHYIANIKANLVNEKDILQYLKENQDIMLTLKQTLQSDINHIEQMRPDIIESWKYFKEFKRMCDELDKDLF